MIKNTLLDYFLDLDPMPDELKNGVLRNELIRQVSAQITTSHHYHKVLILTPGMVPDRIYFVEKGLVRGYLDNGKGKEKTTFLWAENSIIGIAENFISRSPSEIYIEVMPHSILSSVSSQQLAPLIENFPYLSRFLEKLPSYQNQYSYKCFYNFAKPSAWERYLELLNRYPQVEQKISKETIASFIEVTPQYLCRMIKENR
jgi:CRP-like cAMP-binding protein